MSDPKQTRRVSMLGEERTVRREGVADTDQENPYWDAEEPAPHPDPSLGCIRRGLCCKQSPGWFAPGEVEGAAALLDMPVDDFVRAYLVIDWIDLDGERVEVFAPAKLGVDGDPLYPTARRVDALYQMLRSPCIFYTGEGCMIHGAHPLECQRYVCTNAPEDNLSHLEIARLWRDARE